MISVYWIWKAYACALRFYSRSRLKLIKIQELEQKYMKKDGKKQCGRYQQVL
jgi:hypothetical protein